eukprot:1146471-Rhodomonas_salina.1
MPKSSAAAERAGMLYRILQTLVVSTQSQFISGKPVPDTAFHARVGLCRTWKSRLVPSDRGAGTSESPGSTICYLSVGHFIAIRYTVLHILGAPYTVSVRSHEAVAK